jgi:hypothetical protein
MLLKNPTVCSPRRLVPRRPAAILYAEFGSAPLLTAVPAIAGLPVRKAAGPAVGAGIAGRRRGPPELSASSLTF